MGCFNLSFSERNTASRKTHFSTPEFKFETFSEITFQQPLNNKTCCMQRRRFLLSCTRAYPISWRQPLKSIHFHWQHSTVNTSGIDRIRRDESICLLFWVCKVSWEGKNKWTAFLLGVCCVWWYIHLTPVSYSDRFSENIICQQYRMLHPWHTW